MKKKVIVILLGRKKVLKIGNWIANDSSFCGKLVHKSVINRQRKNPNGEKFYPICDKCNSAYVERIMLLPFWNKCGSLQKSIQSNEEELAGLMEKSREIEMEIKKRENLSSKDQNQFESDLENLQNEKNNLDQELNDLLAQIDLLNKREETINTKIIDNDNKINQLYTKINQLYSIL